MPLLLVVGVAAVACVVAGSHRSTDSSVPSGETTVFMGSSPKYQTNHAPRADFADILGRDFLPIVVTVARGRRSGVQT